MKFTSLFFLFAAGLMASASPLMEELNRATTDLDYQYIFQLAVRQRDLPVLQAVLQHREVDPNQAGNQFLMEAVFNRHADMLRAFLADPRVRPIPNGVNVIYGAVSVRDVEAVRLLLQDGRFDPSAEDNRALATAERMGLDEIVQMLRADPRVTG
jgi:hypothetical protein